MCICQFALLYLYRTDQLAKTHATSSTTNTILEGFVFSCKLCFEFGEGWFSCQCQCQCYNCQLQLMIYGLVLYWHADNSHIGSFHRFSRKTVIAFSSLMSPLIMSRNTLHYVHLFMSTPLNILKHLISVLTPPN